MRKNQKSRTITANRGWLDEEVSVVNANVRGSSLSAKEEEVGEVTTYHGLLRAPEVKFLLEANVVVSDLPSIILNQFLSLDENIIGFALGEFQRREFPVLILFIPLREQSACTELSRHASRQGLLCASERETEWKLGERHD